MSGIDLLKELKKLNCAERLEVAEVALRLLREDLQLAAQPATLADTKQQLAKAAQSLLPDYQAGGELTAFTDLDGEDFCAKGQEKGIGYFSPSVP